MKKQYQNPTVECVLLMNEDILTSSVNLSADEGDWILNWSDI